MENPVRIPVLNAITRSRKPIVRHHAYPVFTLLLISTHKPVVANRFWSERIRTIVL